MLFNSIEYLIFLPIVLLIYWLSSHIIQNRFLLAASYLFYGMWDIRFLVLIALSTCVDYIVGLMLDNERATKADFKKSTTWLILSCVLFLIPTWNGISDIKFSAQGFQLSLGLISSWLLLSAIIPSCLKKLDAQQKRKAYLIISVATNLTILGFFKYFDFFVSSAEELIRSFGYDDSLWHLHIILPVGISFYTFQTMSYSIDAYRGKIKATSRFLDFALFVSFFPQLVAGPIERAAHLLPRILEKRSFDIEQAKRGLFLIFWGMFKKVAIADGVAVSVDSIFNTQGTVTSLDIVIASMLFAIQIYCDFSAYSDIARGSSKLLGIELMKNFNLPYFSSNPSEFWRRWHISLSSWLRDYLYISLGGNRGSRFKTYRNLSITMLLGGLWHGAAWNFVLWGAYQGALLSIHRFISEIIPQPAPKNSPNPLNMIGLAKIVFFFFITCYGWLLFRASSLDQVASFTHILFFDWTGFDTTIKRPPLAALFALPLLFTYELSEYLLNDTCFYTKFKPVIHGFATAAIIFCLVMGLSNAPAQFIYFEF